MPLFLTEADVRAVLPMSDLIDGMERALRAYSTGGVVQPVRTVIDSGHDRALFAVMPASVHDAPSLGVKLVTVAHHNVGRGLPSHLATILVLDPVTGALEAIMDGRYITEARTAAVSAVSVRHLARREPSVLTVIGSGVQARSHCRAIALVADLTEIRIWSPDAARRQACVREVSADVSCPVHAANSATTALAGAHIVVLATASPTPVIGNDDVAEGAHICAVGACRPREREMPTSLVARARLYVDSRAGALVESGDVIIPVNEGAITASHIVGELGEVVAGRAAGRRQSSDVTIFKSLGMAVEDVAAARLVLDRARAAGLGLALPA